MLKINNCLRLITFTHKVLLVNGQSASIAGYLEKYTNLLYLAHNHHDVHDHYLITVFHYMQVLRTITMFVFI